MAELTIVHDHDGGTRIEGTVKGDGVLELLTPHGWTWRSYAGVHIRGTRDRFAYPTDLERYAEVLRAAGHTVTVQVDNTWRPAAVRWEERGERVDARVERHEGYAENAAGRSAAARDARRAIGDGIPCGQPILVGHHSEGRSRRDVARMDGHMRREFAEANRAEHHTDRAAGAARNEDAKHNPRAIMRKIETLETETRRVHRRLANTDNPDNEWATIARLRAEQNEEEVAYLRGILAAHADAGSFVAWSAENVAKGDRVRISNRWHEVTRVNRKGVSVRNRWAAVYQTDRSSPVTWDEIGGRRRGDEQIDTPNGEPWPVALARQVARWASLASLAAGTPHDDESRHRQWHVRWAQRIVHGLDIAASDAELAAIKTANLPVEERRALHVRYLAVYDRLAAGESPADVAATTDVHDAAAEWLLPVGQEPQDRRAGPVGSAAADALPMVQPGDLVAGWYDTGVVRRLVRGFCGPVVTVSPPLDRRESGRFVTVTLVGGVSRDFQTHQWLAVYPAGTWENAEGVWPGAWSLAVARTAAT